MAIPTAPVLLRLTVLSHLSPLEWVAVERIVECRLLMQWTAPATGLAMCQSAAVLAECDGLVMTTSGGSATHPITTPFPQEADVVGCIRVERRIEVDQVNALGRDAIAENL